MRSQFSNYEHYNYSKETGLQSTEHGIVGPMEKSARDDPSLSFVQGVQDNSQPMHAYLDFPSAAHQNTDVGFHSAIQSNYFSDCNSQVNEQRTGHNAACTGLSPSIVEDQGGSSQAVADVNDSLIAQQGMQTQEGPPRSFGNQIYSSPKATVQSAPRGSLKGTTRSTVHDRSKLVAKKQQRRSNNAATADATATSLNDRELIQLLLSALEIYV